jgi:hypothetical protein
MGIYYCDHCNKQLNGETFSCYTCGRAGGDGNIFCGSCADAGKCDACCVACCRSCEDERFECCGKVLCGAGADFEKYPMAEKLRAAFDVHRDACVWKHEERGTWDGCGHARCSEQPDGCRTCAVGVAASREAVAIEADTKKAAALLADAATSAAFGAVLRAFVADHHFLANHASELERLKQDARKEKRMRWY